MGFSSSPLLSTSKNSSRGLRAVFTVAEAAAAAEVEASVFAAVHKVRPKSRVTNMVKYQVPESIVDILLTCRHTFTKRSNYH